MKHGFIDIKGSCIIDVSNFTTVPTFSLKLDQKHNKRTREHAIRHQW